MFKVAEITCQIIYSILFIQMLAIGKRRRNLIEKENVDTHL